MDSSWPAIPPPPRSSVGPNAWLVDEMYEQYLADPSLGERELAGVLRRLPARASAAPAPGPGQPSDRRLRPHRARGRGGRTASPTPATPTAGAPPRASARRAAADDAATTEPAASPCAVRPPSSSPTWRPASRCRRPPASARCRPSCSRSTARIINGYLGRTRGGKVSFTHLIGYAVVRAIADDHAGHELDASSRATTASPASSHHDHVGLGLAVDVEKADGRAPCWCPCIRDADTLDFRGFWAAYEDLIRKVRTNKLTADDFAGRHGQPDQPGHHRHRAVGAPPHAGPGRHRRRRRARLPHRVRGRRPRHAGRRSACPRSSRSSSTYDHRIIQGAESGLFLKRVHELLHRAPTTSTTTSSARSACPTRRSSGAATSTRSTTTEAMLEKQMQVDQLVNAAPGARPPHRRPRPAGGRGAAHAPRARPRHLRAHHLGPRPRVPHRRHRRPATAWPLGDAPARAARRLLPHHRHRVHAHPGAGREGAGSSSRSRASTSTLDRRRAAPHPRPAQRGRGAREVPGHQVPRPEALRHRRRRVRHPHPRRRPRRGRRQPTSTRSVMGMAHRGRLNVLVNIVGKSYEQLFKEFEGNVDPDSTQGSGDVKYHLGQTGKFVSRDGNDHRGRAGRQPVAPRGGRPGRRGHGPGQDGPASTRPGATRCCPILIHGDAAFAGQGVVAETLNLSHDQGLPGRRHHPPDHQQPARLHHAARLGPLVGVPAPTWPRWCRRRSST